MDSDYKWRQKLSPGDEVILRSPGLDQHLELCTVAKAYKLHVTLRRWNDKDAFGMLLRWIDNGKPMLFSRNTGYVVARRARYRAWGWQLLEPTDLRRAELKKQNLLAELRHKVVFAEKLGVAELEQVVALLKRLP